MQQNQQLATTQSTTAVAPLDFEKGFTEGQVQLLKDTLCKGATNDELKVFMYVCQRRRLDPFLKQIYAVKRWDSSLKRETVAHQTGIDGFRAIAHRTGEYDGQDGPFWSGQDGIWKDVWAGDEPPHAAKVLVYRKGISRPAVGIAHFEEYVQTKQDGKPNSMWEKMSAGQLAKCAEALAFRKAFPEDIGDLYTPEEMGQADNDRKDPGQEKVNDLKAKLNLAAEPKEVKAEVVQPPPTSSPDLPLNTPKFFPTAPGSEHANYMLPVGVLKGKALQFIHPADLRKQLAAIDEHAKKHGGLPQAWVPVVPVIQAYLKDVDQVVASEPQATNEPLVDPSGAFAQEQATTIN